MLREFASLHGHSHFSVFDGLTLPEEIIKTAKAKGLKSVAITDHGVAHAHADMYIQGKKHGMRTIFGVEAYVIHDLDEWNALKLKIDADRKLKGKAELDAGEELSEENVGKSNARQLRKKGHLVILAKNRKGLANLNELVYKSHKLGFYGKPRMDKKMLRQHAEGLVTSSACMGGVISNKCWDFKERGGSWDEVVHEALEFQDIFGAGNFFLELQFNEHESQKFINDCMVKIHEQTGIPLTVTTDFHYANQNDWEARELLHMLAMNKTVADYGGAVDTEIKQLFIKSPEEMWQTYERYGQNVPAKIAMEAFKNTLLIDSLVEDYEPDTKQRLPTLPFENPFKEMGQRAIDGLRKLGLHENEKYKKQLLHELKVIKEKGIANYFLIVQDIIQEAKKTMLVGAGRGSAAGSLVCYALGITDLDPIAYDLMFERFLDPNRAELPDIDVDFQDVDATKDMLRRMFGDDNVACLSSYGTFQIKGLLKDLGRVFDIDHNEVNKVNKSIEKELRALYIGQDKSTIVIKLEDIERVSPTFNKFVEAHPQVGVHLKTLYGRNRHVGRHAAGVIIGDNLPAETAVFTSKGVVQASFTEGIVNKNISTMGFVKFDILSITTLKVVDFALKLISQRTGKTYEELKESIRPHNMDMNDPKVLKHVFWEGNYAGIFQFTEKGIRRLGTRVKPDTFTDVSAICSIYRPGPLGGGFDKLYVHNKFNPDDVKYDHPLLEDILKPTRGCIVFQEQLMKICNVLGKMSWKDVNAVRKVLLKKDKSKSEEFLKSENERLTNLFLDGCVANGMDRGAAKDLWDKLLKFGGYGFNKAHSDAYTVLTMQTAYLATYFPLEFYSALLTLGASGELQDYVSDIKRCGVKVLPVDINESKQYHKIEGTDSIRLSFSSVLGLGPAAIEKIVTNQPYTDFIDFLDRSGASKTAINPLIMVDAFESISHGKGMKEIEKKYEIYSGNPKLKTKKMRDAWLGIWNEPFEEEEYKLHEKVFFENTLMGFSAKGSPFEILDRDKKLEALAENMMSYKEFLESDVDEVPYAIIPVVVKEFKERPQRNGQMFAFIKFGTPTGEEFESPAFANIWKYIKSKIKKGSVYMGTFNRREDDPESLLIGKPGFGHTMNSALGYMIDLDDLEL